MREGSGQIREEGEVKGGGGGREREREAEGGYGGNTTMNIDTTKVYNIPQHAHSLQ